MWERKELLIWGTTYPEFSKTYYETVCTGAVDMATGRLVRIYPLTLRQMEEPFRLYDVIEAEVERSFDKDPRPESYRIRQQGAVVVGHLDTDDSWRARRRAVLGPSNVFGSLEILKQAQAGNGTSLGLVKPKALTAVYAKKLGIADRQEWEAKRETALRAKDLFIDVDEKTRELQFPGVQYRVSFDCDDVACRGHDVAVLDWGIHVLHLKTLWKKGPAAAETAVVAKVKEILDPATHDSYVFFGNMAAYPSSFSAVGFFYPPIERQGSFGF